MTADVLPQPVTAAMVVAADVLPRPVTAMSLLPAEAQSNPLAGAPRSQETGAILVVTDSTGAVAMLQTAVWTKRPGASWKGEKTTQAIYK
eukprot:scaffold316623_cov21-Tisochrysis_lutea.AAC.1